ncbi:hypothetical protein EOD39_10944 [Acipenser ruthenus]|uniref:Uncharacterized protein n=1 Tax=Acipenser ruthenus TaxID=7906 RepID=A0A662YSV5_ACIRT|nr:hypothetical protein EOD39_10944 [Acipenser ruthenus]
MISITFITHLSITVSPFCNAQPGVSFGGRGDGHGRGSIQGRASSSSSQDLTEHDTWCTEDKSPHAFPFTGVPGINGEEATGLEYLKLFLTDDVMNDIQMLTNLPKNKLKKYQLINPMHK